MGPAQSANVVVEAVAAKEFSGRTLPEDVRFCIEQMQMDAERRGDRQSVQDTHAFACRLAYGYTGTQMRLRHQEHQRGLRQEAMAMGCAHTLDAIQADWQKHHGLYMDPEWDKEYGPNDHFWQGGDPDGLDRGGEPYYCPVSWKRYGIRFPDFSKHMTGKAVAYHGSSHHNAVSLMEKGLRGTAGCYCDGEMVGYLSPSVIYASHHCYAEVWQHPQTKLFYQMVLQCRVKTSAIWKRVPETLCAMKTVDGNFKDNSQLEWLVKAAKKPEADGYVYVPKDHVALYGLMIRKSKQHPQTLPQNNWWLTDSDSDSD
eukprot:CAMPEP_0114643838 /NCGR_PEP_ID=MMETSP0191-20121206/3626_1 /TAXON_ID=126664 /ORGANISM="Sorites sp." /LENGTH=312 /DNA_ID=CAMNT_0001856217 /DNA_START=14 /DNA_END=952 /DNA_ORIENTATION=+